MIVTKYFLQNVLPKRPFLKVAWCEKIVASPLATETQPDGRIRYWGIVPEVKGKIKVLRVVVKPDGTLMNAFLDRDYQMKHYPNGVLP